jgi:hypothetical protein
MKRNSFEEELKRFDVEVKNTNDGLDIKLRLSRYATCTCNKDAAKCNETVGCTDSVCYQEKFDRWKSWYLEEREV